MEARRMVLELHLGNHFYLFDHAAKQRFNSKILSFLLNMIFFFFFSNPDKKHKGKARGTQTMWMGGGAGRPVQWREPAHASPAAFLPTTSAWGWSAGEWRRRRDRRRRRRPSRRRTLPLAPSCPAMRSATPAETARGDGRRELRADGGGGVLLQPPRDVTTRHRRADRRLTDDDGQMSSCYGCESDLAVVSRRTLSKNNAHEPYECFYFISINWEMWIQLWEHIRCWNGLLWLE